MAKLLKLRRGSTSQHSSFTGAEGEVTVDTDKDVLVVHDGSTAGGHPLAAQDMDNVPAGAILGTQLENSGVTAGQYGSSSAIPIVTVDAQGLVTAASTTAIDSTTIANGTSNVAVANNGNITATRSGTARLVVDDAGVDVTGDIVATGDIKAQGNDIRIEGSQPGLHLTDTNNNDDFLIYNNNGSLKIYDATDGADRLSISSAGTVGIGGNLELTTNSAFPLLLSGSDNGKIALQGSSSPFIRFREGTTDKAYIQWDSSQNPGELILVNQESSDYLRIGSGHSGLRYFVDGSDSTIWHAGNDGSGSNLDADLLDGLHGSSYLRTDINDTATGQISLTYSSSYPLNINGGDNAKIVLQGSSSPYIRFREGTTDRAYFQYDSAGNRILLVNQETGETVEIGSGASGLKYTHDGTQSTVWHSGNDGASSGLDADTVDGVQSSSFLRSDANDTASGTITFTNGGGAATIYGGSDIRFENGDWTGNSTKIQQNGGWLYIQSNNSGIIFRGASSDRWYLDSNGHFYPAVNNSFDLGTSSNRVRNIYTNDLNLSNEGSSNDVDGTWGNWTIQEGESDLFLKNNRSGKKYKFNLTEVS